MAGAASRAEGPPGTNSSSPRPASLPGPSPTPSPDPQPPRLPVPAPPPSPNPSDGARPVLLGSPNLLRSTDVSGRAGALIGGGMGSGSGGLGSGFVVAGAIGSVKDEGGIRPIGTGFGSLSPPPPPPRDFAGAGFGCSRG